MTITNEERNELVRLYTEENVSLRKQLADTYEAMIYAQNELADLRAYKERTEAGLHKLSGMIDHFCDVTEDEMRAFGLWRDPPQAEVQP